MITIPSGLTKRIQASSKWLLTGEGLPYILKVDNKRPEFYSEISVVGLTTLITEEDEGSRRVWMETTGTVYAEV